MTDLIESGLSWLRTQRKAQMGRTVVYSRGDDEVEVTATPGQTIVRLSQGAGVEIRERIQDWIIDVADLVLDGAAVEPREGDRITESGNVFEVMKPPGQEPPWRYTDSYRAAYRIHVKEVAA